MGCVQSTSEQLCEQLRLERVRFLTRRHFLRQSQLGLGALALSGLAGAAKPARAAAPAAEENSFAAREPAAVPKARSVIYLHMSGSPPQQDLFDYKPKLVQFTMQPCPDELLKGQRFPFIKGHPKLLGTPYRFRPYGECGTALSELLPGLGSVVDEIALVRSMWTDQFNHAPAELLLHTGSPASAARRWALGSRMGLARRTRTFPASSS